MDNLRLPLALSEPFLWGVIAIWGELDVWHFDGWFMAIGIHMEVRVQGFPAQYCTIATYAHIGYIVVLTLLG